MIKALETWLWYCEPTLSAHCGVSAAEIGDYLQAYAAKQGKALGVLKQEQPKELFERLMRERLRRTISPRDFEKIGEQASITRLRKCQSFDQIATRLQGWFPP